MILTSSMISARTLLTIGALAGGTLVAGCSTPCEDLAERICSCNATYVGAPSKDSCVTSTRNTLKNTHPSGDDQSFCEKTLSTCPDPSNDSTICQRLLTQNGKEACGLAYPAP